MTVTKGFVLALALASAGVIVDAAAPPAGALPAVRLKTISARVDSKSAALVVEATEPVPYVMTRPDPLTVLLDFRNVSFDGVANRVKANAKSPIARVDVESADSLGVATSLGVASVAGAFSADSVAAAATELGERSPAVEQPGVEEVGADAPGLQGELAEAQHLARDRQLEELPLMGLHWRSP
jgi:hypothetical protein